MAKRQRSFLSGLNVDQFMNSFVSTDWSSEVNCEKRRKTEEGSTTEDVNEEGSTTDDVNEEGSTTDDVNEEGSTTDDVNEEGSTTDNNSCSEEYDIGQLEPRPLHITSRKEETCDVYESSDSSDNGKYSKERSEVNPTMIEHWVAAMKKTHSLYSLSQLCTSLHSSLMSVFDSDSSFSHETTHFNHLLVSCLSHVHSCVSYYIPVDNTTLSPFTSHPNWKRVKLILKGYLSDVLLLCEAFRDPSMQNVILREVIFFVKHFACFPKLNKQLHKLLVNCWASSDGHTQVLAFVALKKAVLINPMYVLPETIKKLYLAFVSNSKFLTLHTLHSVDFMQSSLVELLAMNQDTCYQLCFIYVRQLSLTLRTAMTSNKKQVHQTIYNWQYISCLKLWCRVLQETSSSSSLASLIYPLVQTIIGAIQLQPTARYFPVRLHLVRQLLYLGSSTMTYIPVQAYLLEIMEKYGTIEQGHKLTGKSCDLQVMIKASKNDLHSQVYHNAVLNEAFELLLFFLSIHEHKIAFSELSFPILQKLKKLSQSSSLSWFRMQLKQLCEKLEEASKESRKERDCSDMSVNDLEKIENWERQRKAHQSSFTQFKKSP